MRRERSRSSDRTMSISSRTQACHFYHPFRTEEDIDVRGASLPEMRGIIVHFLCRVVTRKVIDERGGERGLMISPRD